jgi:serine/threonine protein kinase
MPAGIDGDACGVQRPALYCSAMARVLRFLQEPIDGKYEVLRVIGEGGMGVVVEVRDSTSGERFAIKVLLDADDAVMRQRFLREARTTARLTSEHAIRVFDVGELPSGEPFMVMELLEGKDLDALIAAEGARPVREAVDYAIQACDALAEAHGLGMVHRDVKPANLFLARRADGTRVVKLLDFGISKAGIVAGVRPTSLTETGSMLGTPHFMAPEQLLSSRDVDARADIWSLGATLFELLGGDVPFDGANLAEIFAAVVRDPPRSLVQLRPDIPPALEQVVARCLEKDPDDRFESVAALARELAPFVPEGGATLKGIGQKLLPVSPTTVSPTTVSPTTVSPLVPVTVIGLEPAPAPAPSPLLPATPTLVSAQDSPPAAPRPASRWWLAIFFVPVAVAALLLPLWWFGLRDDDRAEEKATTRKPKRPKTTASATASATAPSPPSSAGPPTPELTEADRRVPEGIRAQILELLAKGDEALRDGRDGDADKAGELALDLATTAGLTPDHESMLAAHATWIRGEAHRLMLERDLAAGQLASDEAAAAVLHYSLLYQYDPHYRFCASLSTTEIHTAVADAYRKQGYRFDDGETGLVILDQLILAPGTDEGCKQRMREFLARRRGAKPK